MNNLTPQEQAAMDYYRGIPYNNLPPEHKQYYDYLTQKSRVPVAVEKSSTHRTKKMSKPKPKKGKPKETAFIIAFIIILIGFMIFYADYKKGELKSQPAKVVYKKRP